MSRVCVYLFGLHSFRRESKIVATRLRVSCLPLLNLVQELNQAGECMYMCLRGADVLFAHCTCSWPREETAGALHTNFDLYAHRWGKGCRAWGLGCRE